MSKSVEIFAERESGGKMIIVMQVEKEPPQYYKYYDGYRATFGRKVDAVRLEPAMAEMVFNQLRSLHYNVRQMDENERFKRQCESSAP